MACSLLGQNTPAHYFSIASHGGSSSWPEQKFPIESPSGYRLQVIPGSWIEDEELNASHESSKMEETREDPGIGETINKEDNHHKARSPSKKRTITATPNPPGTLARSLDISSTKGMNSTKTQSTALNTLSQREIPELSHPSPTAYSGTREPLSGPFVSVVETTEVKQELLQERHPARPLDARSAGGRAEDSAVPNQVDGEGSASSGPTSSGANLTQTGRSTQSFSRTLPRGGTSSTDIRAACLTLNRPRPFRASIPSGSVLVRVWAVAVDGVDGRLAGSLDLGSDKENDREGGGPERSNDNEIGGKGAATNPFTALSRTLSVHLKRRKSQGMAHSSHSKEEYTRQEKRRMVKPSRGLSLAHSNASLSSLKTKGKAKIQKMEPRPPTTGSTFRDAAPYIPGRSFVGQIEEVGDDVEEDAQKRKSNGLKRGEWVVGLVDVRKSGALAEFIIVDWRRLHRVPKECIAFPSVEVSRSSHGKLLDKGNDYQMLTLEELALLPLCGIPAYRAVGTFLQAFIDDHESVDYTKQNSMVEAEHTSQDDTPTQNRPYSLPNRQRQRRALILRGTDGAGALAAQMLIRLGWRVSVHVPFSRVPENATQDLANAYMSLIEEQARSWGADEVIFDDAEAERKGEGFGRRTRDAVLRVIKTIQKDGDVFDAVLDTVGGKEVRQACERFLSPNEGTKQFTTLVGDTPELAVPNNVDALRVLDDSGRVGYTCVSVAHDGSEDEEIFEMLGAILNLTIKTGIRPIVEDPSGEIFSREKRVMGFDKALDVFMNNNDRHSWWLADGGTLVIKLVA